MNPGHSNRTEAVTFEDFKKLASDDSLSPIEKIGFPNSYRDGKEQPIFDDIQRKLPNLRKTGQIVLDIGPGCSGPAFLLVDLCRRQSHDLILIDSKEMLSHLPSEPFITKVSGRYPDETRALFEEYTGRADVIICYSVLHYVYAEANLFDFLDRSISLLSDGGEMLIGDIPNVSKRKRFFSSPAGVQFHKDFTGKDEIPEVRFNTLEPGHIDDSVLLALVARARSAGCDAYLLPQPPELPMTNRREDLLITKP